MPLPPAPHVAVGSVTVCVVTRGPGLNKPRAAAGHPPTVGASKSLASGCTVQTDRLQEGMPRLQRLSTAAKSAAIAEAGGLSWMSHRPEVPSTLKFLEGVEASFLLSLEFFHFLFLHQEPQVSRFPESPSFLAAPFQVLPAQQQAPQGAPSAGDPLSL